MSVQSQADVGALSIRGLGAFSTVLATLSADNVSPIAMVQMEQLGSHFLTNGPHAEKCKGLMQRCSNTRLDRLGLLIGWRKNDAVSLMANSAGGQAIALLCVCLRESLGRDRDIGYALSTLSSKLLPQNMHVASMAQLAEVASLLSDKLNPVGFGNILAKESKRTHEVYEKLNREVPVDIFSRIDPHGLSEVLVAISKALKEERSLCRISGSGGMSYMLTVLQILLPRSLRITVEGFMLQDVQEPKIFVEIYTTGTTEPLRYRLETSLDADDAISGLIGPYELSRRLPFNPEITAINYTWSGWLKTMMEIVWLQRGLMIDADTLSALHNFVLSLPSSMYLMNSRFLPSRPSKCRQSLQTLLGPCASARKWKLCNDMLLTTESPAVHQSKITGRRFIQAVEKSFERQSMFRHEEGEATSSGIARCWFGERRNSPGPPCKFSAIQKDLGNLIYRAVLAFFVDIDANMVKCGVESFGAVEGTQIFDVVDDREVCLQLGDFMKDLQTYNASLSTTDHRDPLLIATSVNGTTMYPSILNTLCMPPRQGLRYRLVDGRLLFRDRAHRSLRDISRHQYNTSAADFVECSLDRRPSSSGVHDGTPSIAVSEAYDCLEIISIIQYLGKVIFFSLSSLVRNYTVLSWTLPCQHPMDQPLDTKYQDIHFTSVARPFAARQKSIVMTRGHPVAQLLCCHNLPQLAFLQNECCLNCAIEQVELLLEDKEEGATAAEWTIICR